jgi:hypothetical protein
MGARFSRGRLAFAIVLLGSSCARDQAPPRDPPMGRLAAGVLRDTAFTWQTRRNEHFRIHVQPGSYAAGHLDRFVADAEEARENALRLLGEHEFRPRIDVFHLESREQMRHITEFAVRGWTDPEARTVLLVRGTPSNQGERHEIAHVLSHNLWGHSHDWLTTGWMSEGLATWAGGRCSGYAIDEIVAYLDRRGELIPLDSLARHFRSFDDLQAYLQAGSFVGWVREAHGLPAVRALWEQGYDSLPVILGKDPRAVDAEWRARLRATYPGPTVSWATLKAHGCQ